MDKIFEIIKILVASGVITTGLVWLVKKIIELFFNKDLEKFKSDLEKEAIKYRIQFSNLHTERCEVIKEVYSRMIRTQRALKSLVNPLQLVGEPSEKEKKENFIREANNFLDFYLENRIYFEEALALKIDELEKKFREVWNSFSLSRDMTGDPKFIEIWGQAWDKIEKEIPAIKEGIEKEFRWILGIEK